MEDYCKKRFSAGRTALFAYQMVSFLFSIEFGIVLAFNSNVWVSFQHNHIIMFQATISHYQSYDLSTHTMSDWTNFSTFPDPKDHGFGKTVLAFTATSITLPIFLLCVLACKDGTNGQWLVVSAITGVVNAALSISIYVAKEDYYNSLQQQVQLLYPTLERVYEKGDDVFGKIFHWTLANVCINLIGLVDYLVFHCEDPSRQDYVECVQECFKFLFACIRDILCCPISCTTWFAKGCRERPMDAVV